MKSAYINTILFILFFSLTLSAQEDWARVNACKYPNYSNENIIRIISQKKDEPKWLLDWRLKAFKLCEIFEYSKLFASISKSLSSEIALPFFA